ncbi:MAG: hypothetical protein Q7S86_02915 [bacterium]|nr:hypothetical protein [bacterium]
MKKIPSLLASLILALIIPHNLCAAEPTPSLIEEWRPVQVFEKVFGSPWVLSFPSTHGGRTSSMNVLIEFDKSIELVSVQKGPPRKVGNQEIPGEVLKVTARKKGTDFYITFDIELPIEDYRILWRGVDPKELARKAAIAEANTSERLKKLDKK